MSLIEYLEEVRSTRVYDTGRLVNILCENSPEDGYFASSFDTDTIHSLLLEFLNNKIVFTDDEIIKMTNYQSISRKTLELIFDYEHVLTDNIVKSLYSYNSSYYIPETYFNKYQLKIPKHVLGLHICYHHEFYTKYTSYKLSPMQKFYLLCKRKVNKDILLKLRISDKVISKLIDSFEEEYIIINPNFGFNIYYNVKLLYCLYPLVITNKILDSIENTNINTQDAFNKIFFYT